MNIEDGEVTATEKGGANGPETTEDQTTLDTQPESGAEPNIDGGAEDQAVGEETGEVEGDVSETPEAAKPDPLIEINKVIEDKFKSLEEKLKPAEPAPPPIPEEKWVESENKWGVPRTAIQETIRVAMQVKNEIKEYVDAQFAELRKDSIMADVAKQNGIANYKSLEPGINEFLSAFDSKHHSNPELLKRAMFYARGMNAPKDVKRIQANDEKNRQVVNRIKTGRADVRPSGVNAQKGLNETQREAAEMIGESEYLKIKNNKSRVIAV